MGIFFFIRKTYIRVQTSTTTHSRVEEN